MLSINLVSSAACTLYIPSGSVALVTEHNYMLSLMFLCCLSPIYAVHLICHCNGSLPPQTKILTRFVVKFVFLHFSFIHSIMNLEHGMHAPARCTLIISVVLHICPPSGPYPLGVVH